MVKKLKKESEEFSGEIEQIDEVKTESKKEFLAVKTLKVQCNGIFDLVAGEPVPEGISEAHLTSLLNSNIIK